MQYEDRDNKSYRIDEEGNVEMMANFTAEITAEVRYVDGLNTRAVLTVEGLMPPKDEKDEPVKLPPVEVDAEAFQALGWVMPNWGVRCVIRPGSGMKDDLRTFIQLRSSPTLKTIYRHTGWTEIGGKPVFLHAGGGVGPTGNNRGVSVQLPPELAKYDLTHECSPGQGVTAALQLLDLARRDLTWPLLAGTLAPLYGPVDFALHLTGRTGSFKSEVMSLFQSFYGSRMDARNLPGSWSSTPNALEALAFFAKNAAFVVDDFVPAGTSWQQKAYQTNADKLIRAQGNQAGRARLTDAANLQQTMYPRGVILSTGEDTPEGHSVRARMLIMEVAGGEISADALTVAQRMRPMFPACTAFLAQSLAARPDTATKARTEQLRSAYRAIGHSRTPGMLGRLVATAEDFVRRAVEAGVIPKAEQNAYLADAKQAIEAAGAKQQSYLEDADPVDIFNQAIRQALASGAGHFRSVNGGVPKSAEVLGWSSEQSMGEIATFKARGVCIGWVSVPKDEMYLDVTAGYPVIKKVAGQELSLSKQTLFKRLKDAGAVTRIDEGRQRNTVRVTAENHPRQVLCLSLSTVLDQEEADDGSDDGSDDE